jgi:subtilisin family serine protease
VADAVAYAVDNGAQVVNLSLGGTEDSPLMRDAVSYAETRGILVVAAAGNTGAAVLYPAAYESAVAVAASDAYDRWASYSGHGPEIDITAPGTGIWSTCLGDGYCGMSGTSMATPHVAGLAALIWSHYPTFAAAQVRQRMLEGAQDLGSPGWDPNTGWGRIDAQRALAAPVLSRRLYFPVANQRAPLSLP